MLDIDASARTQRAPRSVAATRCWRVACDVSDPAQVDAALAAVDARFGRLDALVNNAGIAVFKPLRETSFDDWSRVLAVNLNGPFLCTQAARR